MDRVQFQTVYIANLPFPAPPKPKLVARTAGSETFPWKVRNDAPKISAKDVPGALRPLMSCALWRLHESIERNDANQLFLLSDQTEICSVAQKLNIIARLPRDVAATIASKTSRTHLNNFGDLEREFGVRQKSAPSATEVAKEVNVENGTSENQNEDLSKDEDAMNNSISSEVTANTDASSIMHEQDLEQQIFERGEKNSPVNGDRGEDKVKEQDRVAEAAAALAAESLSKMPVKSAESIKSIADGSNQQDFQKHLGESVDGFNLDGVRSQGNLANQSVSEHSVMRSPPKTPLPQPLPQSVEPLQPAQEVQTIGDNSPFKHTPTHSTSKPQAAQEPEDSDEEVVVFIPQPKRLSAQQKPAQQSSRPSTPKEQSQQKAAGRSPQRSLVKPQSKGKAARHSPNPSTVGQPHPQPVNSPTVIDPDAFGRDFRVNINPSPRPPPNPNGHSNHRIRGNMQTAPAGQVPRNLPRQHARTSPPRNVPQENSRRLAPIPGPASKDAPNHRRQGSRTSPRRSPAPKAKEVVPADIQSRVPTAAVSPKSQFSESRKFESTEFVPRTTLSTAQLEPNEFQSGAYDPTDGVPSGLPSPQLKPSAPQPRVYEASEFVPRPPRPVRELKPRAPKPKVFEAGEFVPRDFVPKANLPRTQLKQYSPERESIEPRPSINDVDYVLKSGSTRASARGTGRLWTPS